MSCTDVASILDTHRSARLGPAERAHVDTHLAACADCAAAWHAQVELLALRVPPLPATLLERALLASRVPQNVPARRARVAVAVGGAVLAAAAAAAVTIVSFTREEAAPTVPSPLESSAAPAATGTAPNDVPQVDAARAAPRGDGVTSVELVELALSIQPLVRKAPDYPPDALTQKLEGHVQLKFDVTPAGTVENLTVVESSDALFEDSAVRAVSGWRYLPRIAAGKRAGSRGVHTVLRFALAPERNPAAPKPLSTEAQEAAIRERVAFNMDLELAMDRLAADDLRGTELQLDQMQAIYGPGRADVATFYGYLFTVQGNYDRAIDAYETAVAAFAAAGQPASGPWVALANLYFARHQYDIALKTLVTYRDRITAAQAQNPGRPLRPLDDEAVHLVEQLRALGVADPSL
jgi:TonB family protein